MLNNKKSRNQSGSCCFNVFVLPSQRFFSKHIKRLKIIPTLRHSRRTQHGLIFQVHSDVPGRLAAASQDSWLNSSLTGSERSEPGPVSEARRKGVGQEKRERANSAGELQQSLHKRGGLCNACGFVLRNSGRAKHIQMCQMGQKPIVYEHSHTYMNTHRGMKRGGKHS